MEFLLFKGYLMHFLVKKCFSLSLCLLRLQKKRLFFFSLMVFIMFEVLSPMSNDIYVNEVPVIFFPENV